jgi:hypothetical protein
MFDDNIFGTTGPVGTGQTLYGLNLIDQEADLPLARDPSGNPTWDFQFTDLGKLLNNLGIGSNSGLGQALGGITSLLGGKSGGQLGSFLGSAGLGMLLNRFGNNAPAPVGYQGGIPKYTIERTQTPIAQQRPVRYEAITPKEGEMVPAVMRPVPYRPGQGGITYFSPIKYVPTGKDLAAPVAEAPVVAPTPVPTPENTETISAASGGAMPGGIAMLARGRYLKGKGDGVSDSIPAQFVGSGRRAALADGEFVIPARVVAELGNGSSDAGARKLYAFMDRVEKKGKTAKRGKPSGADKELNRLA